MFPLTETYGQNIRCTLTEPSSSIVPRSEHQFSKDERVRLSLRKHFHEVLSDSPSEHPFACGGLDGEPVRFGEYLGFVDLRLRFAVAPIALGLLAPPGPLRDKDTAIVLGEYGSMFGGLAFPCTVFSMQDEQYGGAVCAHACVIMALGMLADRGARIHGSYTLAFLGNRPLGKGACGREGEEGVPEKRFGVYGLSTKEICGLIHACGAFGHPYIRGGSGEERLIGKLIEAHIEARFPIIMLVDTEAWHNTTRPGVARPRDARLQENLPHETRSEEPEPGHAVTIVGFRRVLGSREIELVVHDPAYIPYMAVPLSSCLESTRSLKRRQGWDGNGKPIYEPTEETHLAFTGDGAINVFAGDCLAVAAETSPQFRRIIEDEKAGDYSIRLLRGEDVAAAYAPAAGRTIQQARLEADELKAVLDKRRRYWCIEARSKRRPDRSELLVFAAEDGPASDGPAEGQPARLPVLAARAVITTQSDSQGEDGFGAG
jgi:hypothetical protein